MTANDVDPAIAEMVERVTNRWGVDGLDQLIHLAEQNRETAEAALRELAVAAR